MIIQEKIKMSQQGFDDIKKELSDRINVVRNEVANEIERAREQGDLSENSAYKGALEQKEFNETRIIELENILKNVEVIKTKTNKGVGIGSKVKLQLVENKKILEFEIVGGREADSGNNKISLDSPLVKKLIGKKVNDIIKVTSPIGEIEYKIISLM